MIFQKPLLLRAKYIYELAYKMKKVPSWNH